MRDAVFEHRPKADIIIKAAAVSDYRPRANAGHKIKKGANSLNLELVRNPDILRELASEKGKPPCLLVGFAAETENLLSHAKQKLKSKALDMIVANDVSREDAGFETDTNLVKIVYKDGQVEEVPLMTKLQVADVLLDRIKKAWEARLET
jgi:phosphopantothenoylcysteine decarboxylase/phosphopantothenate--cysteine ligase